MPDIARLKKRAAELEQRKQLDKALDVYIQLLNEAGRELEDVDVPLYNRVGDLLSRQGKVSDALGYYERAVDVYAERGYLNNAIALCNKILRQSPGRTAVYYKLGKISASKGFHSDARRNFLEYADRVQKAGNLDEAFRALKEFAALFPDQDDIRLILAEQLSKENRKGEALEQLNTLYQKLESEGRRAEARATIDRMKAIDPGATPVGSGAHRSQRPNDLVFLDLSDEERPARSSPPAEPEKAKPDAGVQSDVPALEGLLLTFVPDENEPAPPRAESSRTDAPPAPSHTVPPAPQATDDGERDPSERTGEFEIVPAPVPVDFETVEEQRHFTEGLEIEPALGMVEMEPEPETQATEPPLSGVEFAELDLSEVSRPSEEREHDLALPSRLPMLHEAGAVADSHAPLSGAHEIIALDNLAVSASPPAVPAQPVQGAGQRPDEDPEELAEVDSLLLDETAAGEPHSESVPAGEHDDTERDSGGRGAIFQEMVSSVLGLETEDVVAKGSSAPEPPAHFDDLLREPPSFGGATPHDGPVFSPIPGLSDDRADVLTPVAASEGAPEEAREEAASLPNAEDRVIASGDAAAAIGDEPVVEPPDDPDAQVEAPLPHGFARTAPQAEAEIDGQSGANRRDADASAAPTEASETVSHSTPRATVSLGGAEAHLRRRLELDPENWRLRQQLGETLLDSGNRDEGLYELELGMTGFELAGDLESAQGIADEIARVMPASVRHHQKRVEYAVRAKDRARLIEAYLELADALFRTGEADKSVAVYARVLELAPDNDRAMFALSALAPDHVTRRGGAAARHRRWSEELDAIGEGSGPVEAYEAAPEATAPFAASGDLPAHDREGIEADEAFEEDREPAGAGAASSSRLTPRDVAVTASLEGGDNGAPPVPARPRTASGSMPRIPTPASGMRTAVGSARVAEPPIVESKPEMPFDPPRRATPAAGSSGLMRPRALTPPRVGHDDYVDLGEWLRETEPEKSTRIVVDDARPTGDERADFEELLRRFKHGLAENVDAEDFDAHYDLGVAFKEMGLIDEAIAEFQKALRGSTNRVRSYEALGQCFVEKEQYPIAAALLQRAVETPGIDDHVLVGVLYLLGFASEKTGRHADALRYYQRVFAVDLQFRDISQRVSAMEHLTK